MKWKTEDVQTCTDSGNNAHAQNCGPGRIFRPGNEAISVHAVIRDLHTIIHGQPGASAMR